MRVLIAEDEPRIAADVKLGLERAGYVADVVGDGEAALVDEDEAATARAQARAERVAALTGAGGSAPSSAEVRATSLEATTPDTTLPEVTGDPERARKGVGIGALAVGNVKYQTQCRLFRRMLDAHHPRRA